jgi:RNA polymerase sigma-70 factor (ECF subfamily)
MSEPTYTGRPPDFEEWYRDVADQLTQRIAAAVGDPVFGRELAAEAFARAYDKWGRVAKMDSPSGWVYRTALNLSKRSWRRRAIERRAVAKLNSGLADLVDHSAIMASPDAPQVEVAGHFPEVLTPLVAELPERMRTAIELRYWHGLSEAEVAARMQISTGTASATLSNARKRLEARLQELEQDRWER